MWKTILLFVLLSPGVLLTIPPVGKKIWMSGKTSLLSVCVHALIFVLVMRLLNVRERFQSGGASTSFIVSYTGSLPPSKNVAIAKTLGGGYITIKTNSPKIGQNIWTINKAGISASSLAAAVKKNAPTLTNFKVLSVSTSTGYGDEVAVEDVPATGFPMQTVFVVSYTGSLPPSKNVAIAKPLGGGFITIKTNSPKPGQNTWTINKAGIPASSLAAAVNKNAPTLTNFKVLSVGQQATVSTSTGYGDEVAVEDVPATGFPMATPKPPTTASAGSSILSSIVDTLTGGSSMM